MDVITNVEFLRKVCAPVESVQLGSLLWNDYWGHGDEAQKVVDTMLDELRTRQGVGLAAIQLGYLWRLIVVRLYPSPQMVCVLNPEISKAKGIQKGEEGCLSLPGVIVELKRPKEVVLRGINRYGVAVRYRYNGVHARIACHEVDHLDGKLIID